MNLFDLFVRVGIDDQASKQVAALSQNLGAGLKKAAAIGTAAVGTAAAGYVALTKKAIDAYAEYEQLVGGVETLFGAGGKTIEEYAKEQGRNVSLVRVEYARMMEAKRTVLENAFKGYETAGASANKYLQIVTSFSASLKQSLGGDVVAAANLADQALRDISDNSNKFGTDISSIQQAYLSFSRQQFQLLDNLKLGYGGTREEMRRLISDAAALDDSIDANSLSFANIVRAINVVQTELGITGTTSKEAATTITGSTNAAKAAWSNLVAGLADDEADIDALVKNFADSVVTVGKNLIPRVARVGESVIGLIKNYGNVAINQVKANAPGWWDKVQNYMEDNLPDDIKAGEKYASNFINSAAEWIGNGKAIGEAMKFASNLGNAIISGDNSIEDASKNFVLSFVDGMIVSVSNEDVQERFGVFLGNLVKRMYKMSNIEEITNMINSLLDMTSGEYDEQFGQNAVKNNKGLFSGIKSFGKGFSSVFKTKQAEIDVPEPEVVVHEHNINMSVESTGDSDIDDIVEEAAGRAASYIQERLDQRKAVVYG